MKGIVDVDRLDYLRRDAFHTGVPIGVDPGEIIAAYTLAQVSSPEEPYLRFRTERPATGDDPPPTGTPTWTLKLEARVAPAIERMLSTRDSAYRELYYHPTNRAVQEMLILGMQRLTRRKPDDDLTTDVASSDLDAMTDAELLIAIERQTDPMLKVLYLGLRHRQLYEPLGCRLKVATWTEEALSELGDLREGGNARLREHMRRIAPDLGIELVGKSPGRLLVDISSTPVVDELAYRNRILWEGNGQTIAYQDEKSAEKPPPWQTARVGYSLLERLPHLGARHGVTWDGGTRHDRHLDYMQEIQEILFFVPPEFLDAIQAELCAAKDRPATCTNIFETRLKPILTGVWELLYTETRFPGLRPGEWDPSFERAAMALGDWLRSEDDFPLSGHRRS